MATKKARRKTCDRRRRLQIAAKNLNRLSGSLDALIERMEAGEVVTPGDVTGAVTGLSKALNNVVSEGAKVDDALAREDGIEGGYALDLEAARAEIGGRLDRLRRAGAD
ncbi:hypothetical protein [Anianabacter salinae]|uniref:hypothetical protein n=1 Tax=Anianabacter salinae TaxID=2851023 RepID=UPI00225E55E8|nr:hypothetical protein [Anianabacter salinae]